MAGSKATAGPGRWYVPTARIGIGIAFAGVGMVCAAIRADEPVSAATIAAQILDDTRSPDERRQLVADYPALAVELIRAMTDRLEPGNEENRRIPWISRIAVSAATRNEGTQIRDLLAQSLPPVNERLCDWQAVVIGGGMIRGLSQSQLSPREEIAHLVANDADLTARWERVMVRAGWMADDEEVPAGTRHAALRILGCGEWDPHGLQLLRYLSAGTHDDLQRGAVGGLVDIDSPYSTKALSDAFLHLKGPNRRLAIAGLLRDAGRCDALLFSIQAGRVSDVELEPEQIKLLREHPEPKVRDRAAQVLPSE